MTCTGVGLAVVSKWNINRPDPVMSDVIRLNSELIMSFPVDSKWIVATEQKLGVRFPASYATSMATLNGGTVISSVDHWSLFHILDSSDRKRIARTCSSVDRETASARANSYGFPPDAVVIGENGGGDSLILKPMDDHPDTLQHAVYWWDHETGESHSLVDDFGDLPKTK
ncbi:SMI1 / KNR4 family protein [Rubripirellula obstinata]|uniref:SMI1 / KNR4 family protein n=1 Tax=Rubripirellula obstinata TaxID=406547 RepID=A0A5B1CB55_9BACT|nr:SMI1/KNR4 family protein [Rubripirellula obstinata]KAA1257441.1 SMI1 / KNR4 family protein [Rubripirellula obstinata]